ncbi:hypothetical protein SEVIR_5G249301v4 [Setaria viridis]|uniref:Protein kinase domain-containing protein n=1 Tax=Setaria viridis TaxID=4556 RepID=A0A4U6UHI0_SETVI|nr:hypothetical protein SEVIR_5G249301v2 [Setaria viridis]
MHSLSAAVFGASTCSMRGNWVYGNPRGGCTRNAKLQCVANSSRNAEVDGFYALAVAKLPDKTWSAVAATADGCKQACLSNCSCAAYFYADTCSLWYGDLFNLVAPTDGSIKYIIYVRPAASELFSVSRKTSKALIVWALTGGTILVILGVLLILTKWFCSKKNKIEGSLVVFRFRNLRSLTKNFSERLGKGSFGSVYKGMLPDGTLVAVKKLDGLSQGEKQFRAAVSTIGTIQHVNLIRLLGFCPELSMKALVYEYMPNGSLDPNIFGGAVTISWNVRFFFFLEYAGELRIIPLRRDR